VAGAASVDRPLTYLPPSDCKQELVPGLRVLVPLGRRKTTGYILSTQDSTLADQQLKPIYEILDSSPIFPAQQVEFYRWISRYYHFPIGEVLKTALPAGLTTKSGRRVLVTPDGIEHISALNEAQLNKFSWIAGLLTKGQLSPSLSAKLWRTKDRRLLEEWQKEGFVIIQAELVEGTAKAKTETCVALATPYFNDQNDLADSIKLKKSERKTLDIFLQLQKSANRSTIPRRDITRIYSGAGKGLRELAEKNIIFLKEEQVYRDPFGESLAEFDIPEKLTVEQKTALDQVLPVLEQRKFKTFLLHGVTGSGKTEVYLQAAEATLKQSRSVLVLVPEIALATQLESHFLSRFGNLVALMHSGLTSGQRFDQWNKIKKGLASVVIGARSAIFSPLADPGLIIVDEEHDSSYKQDDGFRYQARDLAVLRGSQCDAVVILGSATPSVISYHHTLQGKYQLLSLEKRIWDRPLPDVQVVNMLAIKTVSGRPAVFSNELINGLRKNLENQEQSLIFLNRRGYANYMVCRDCGQPIQCKHCQISLTLHKTTGKLLCHYCAYTVPSKTVCANCQSSSLVAIGVGTQRLQDELTKLFPKARIERLDRDTCAKRNDYLRVLKAVHRGEVDILLGTQMITKGHHFPNVTLVGIVLADTGLGLPDFRAGERTFQMISQVTGRAGRGEKPGRVIVQTFQPEHHSIEMSTSHDYLGMYNREIGLRKRLAYPPFARLINLRIEGREEKDVHAAAQELSIKAIGLNKKKSEPEILGPAPAPLVRLRDKYRYQLLLKGRELESLHGLVGRLHKDITLFNNAGKVRISVDVDPEFMM
jgi:primosomal protein N' (replication factor Y)